MAESGQVPLTHWFTARDGVSYLVYRLQSENMSAVHRFYNALTDEDRQLRLLSTTPYVSYELARILCGIDHKDSICLVVEGQGDLKGEMIGGIRLAHIRPDNIAEFAVSIHPDVRRLGLASHLLKEAIGIARNNGATRLEGLVAYDNRNMRALARDLGFMVRSEPYDRSVLKIVLPLSMPECANDAVPPQKTAA